jgi:hypothetical protein
LCSLQHAHRTSSCCWRIDRQSGRTNLAALPWRRPPQELFDEAEQAAGRSGPVRSCQLRLVLLYELFTEPRALVSWV